MTMRIVVNGRELTRGVMTSLGYILCRVLPYLGERFEVEVITPRGPLNPNAQALFVAPGLRRIESASDCCGIWGRLTFYMALYRHIRRSRADWFWEINHVLAPVPRRTRTAVTIHDLYLLHADLNSSRAMAWLFRLNLTLSVRMASLVMFPSQTTRAELHAKIGAPRGREAILPNGAWDRLPRPRLRGRWQPGAAIVGYLGRVNYWKGADQLLRHAEASDRVAQLFLAGAADQKFLTDLRARSPEIFHKASLLGPVSEEEKAAFLGEIDVFAYETRYDGFGIPPLEAMLHRIPVVASDIPVMREVLGPYAVYLRASAADPLGDAIARLEALDNAAFESFLDAAETHARAFSWERYASSLIQLLTADEPAQ
ncbi:glycosyltransferase [Phaeovulum sp.]|uniref:glycosyltransferase n=1 Tax=Phaeovulum sp. TaxID=2934796 RepID=UPI003565BE94